MPPRCASRRQRAGYRELLYIYERTLQVGEVARVQDPNPRVVLSVEWRHRGRTPGISCVRGRIEPEAQIVHLDSSAGSSKRLEMHC